MRCWILVIVVGEEGWRERVVFYLGINIFFDLEIMFLGLKIKFKIKNC